MASFKGQFSAAQLDIVNQRATIVEKQPPSTATLTAGDEENEFYLDDPAAQFVTNGVDSGDTLEITSGTSPLGSYTVSGRYFDPGVDGVDQEPSETRIIGIGYPTPGSVSYRVVETNDIWSELNSLTETNSLLQNIVNVELQALDDVFDVYLSQFDLMCNLVTAVHAWILEFSRLQLSPALLDAATNPNNAAYGDNALFPLDYIGLTPVRNVIYPTQPYPIDLFTVPVSGGPTLNNSESAGVDDEDDAEAASSGGPLLTAYTDALDKQENALAQQELALQAIEAEIAANDTATEAGDYVPMYTALPPLIANLRASMQLRQDDIDDIRTADDTRPNVGGLNFGSFAAVQAELASQAATLNTLAGWVAFLDERYTWLNNRTNRAFGTLNDINGNLATISLNASRAQMLIDERTGHRTLLELP